jgi:hypothetical protein
MCEFLEEEPRELQRSVALPMVEQESDSVTQDLPQLAERRFAAEAFAPVGTGKQASLLKDIESQMAKVGTCEERARGTPARDAP